MAGGGLGTRLGCRNDRYGYKRQDWGKEILPPDVISSSARNDSRPTEASDPPPHNPFQLKDEISLPPFHVEAPFFFAMKACEFAALITKDFRAALTVEQSKMVVVVARACVAGVGGIDSDVAMLVWALHQRCCAALSSCITRGLHLSCRLQCGSQTTTIHVQPKPSLQRVRLPSLTRFSSGISARRSLASSSREKKTKK